MNWSSSDRPVGGQTGRVGRWREQDHHWLPITCSIAVFEATREPRGGGGDAQISADGRAHLVVKGAQQVAEAVVQNVHPRDRRQEAILRPAAQRLLGAGGGRGHGSEGLPAGPGGQNIHTSMQPLRLPMDENNRESFGCPASGTGFLPSKTLRRLVHLERAWTAGARRKARTTHRRLGV